jgi:DNA-binding NarL/FixJ family response regulator
MNVTPPHQPTAEPPHRVLLVDDHPLFREGLAAAIDSDQAFTVVGQAATAEEAIAEADRTGPDVVIMDLGLPGRPGVEAIRALLAAHPGLRILVMTMSEDRDSLLAAMRAGSHGYILKGAPRTETLWALHTVAHGGAVFSSRVAQSVTHLLTAGDTSTARQAFPALTARELEILDLLARGRTYRQIARDLVVTEKTIRNHAGSIFAKLQVPGRAEAIVRAREAGLGNT